MNPFPTMFFSASSSQLVFSFRSLASMSCRKEMYNQVTDDEDEEERKTVASTVQCWVSFGDIEHLQEE